jgi:hypothetical protein
MSHGLSRALARRSWQVFVEDAFQLFCLAPRGLSNKYMNYGFSQLLKRFDFDGAAASAIMSVSGSLKGRLHGALC